MSNGSGCIFVVSALLVAVFGVVPHGARAQTPAQMEYERQQREYRQQQEQQRQEQLRQQQLMNENARRQQEESRRLNAPIGQQSQSLPMGQGSSGGGGAIGGADTGAALEAARRAWLRRPALAPDRNPLLGSRWMRPPSTQPSSSDPFAGLMAMAKGGLCEVLFGGGVFEFRPETMVAIDPRSKHEMELDRVDYRGDARRVAVIPRTTLRLIEFDVESPNRINWSSQKCVLVRATPADTAALPPAAGGGMRRAATPAGPDAKTSGLLSLSVSSASPGSFNVAGRTLWVLRKDAQMALIEGGLKSTPYASVLQNWMRACRSRAPECQQGALALKTYSIGVATTDASGHTQSASLPVGRYWVLGDARIGNRQMMWHELVDLKAGPTSVTLSERNAMPVD